MDFSPTATLLRAAFPRELEDDVDRVLQTLDPARSEPHMTRAACLNVGEHQVTVPDRLYFPPAHPDPVTHLTLVQQAIRGALMTRNISGYEREAGARILLGHPAPWAVPFLALLLGEYVIEIHEALSEDAAEAWTPLAQSFAAQNQAFRTVLSQRIVSYWDAYYRKYVPLLSNHPSLRLARQWGLWDETVAHQFLHRELRKRARRRLS